MRIAEWARELIAVPALVNDYASLTGAQDWTSVTAEARPIVLATQYRHHPTKVLVVTASYDRALAWQAKLVLCGVPDSQIRQLPSGLSALFEDAAPETIALSDRVGALRFLIEPGPGIVVATPQAVLERTLPRDILESAFLCIEQGQSISPEEVTRTLNILGYEAAEPVRIPGQYSRRGGILDVFPMGADSPVRIEFFDIEIESLRKFDPNTQRSLGAVPQLVLAPSRETLYPAEGEDRSALTDMLRRSAAGEAGRLNEAAAHTLEETIAGDAAAIDSGVFFDRLDLYRPMLHADSGCAVDLMDETAWLVLDDPSELDRIAARSEDELGQALASRAARGEILHSTTYDYMLPPDRLGDHALRWAFSGFAEGARPEWLTGGIPGGPEISTLERYRGQPTELTRALADWSKDGYAIIIGSDQPSRARAMLEQIEMVPSADGPSAADSPGYWLLGGNLAGGFVLPHAKIALITDHELFGVGRLKLPQRKFNEGVPIANVLDLKSGDYVVHINFGIGIFRGLVRRVVDGVEKEYLYLDYQAPDKLYVPAEQLDRIQKYLNPSENEPRLNRLTGGEWQRAVGKAREEARAFARDLIKIYAQRKRAQRPGFGPDSPWQAEMEATFPWVETPSQLHAIRDAKNDLQLDFPMDRLICGDVGFGKTEVAIRAAFKVAQTDRQVAVLCPTTILSEQHFRNFAERLAPFPTRLEYLNRFRSGADRKRILEELHDGKIDILVGTHALLGGELKWKNLGLVIIDEEQKFGVKQKELLKQLRANVDVLSMSATPIPRTLSMALMDIRQMSLINDPPPGRLPIRTFVRPHSNEVVKEAILRELARGGQVYYVYNRVQGIYHIEERLKKMFPNARIAVGHGQMGEKELEPVMLAFIKGEVDILLSTTIVENGLDISNANTLIVENADFLGLSQLYQLRGRVGRSDRQAYAYFLYHSERGLTENATSRLQSLQEFSSLGSGYSLAFRDLQIRGAGELLGAKQSGTMATVGYELFAQIIQEEVLFLKAHADGEGDREYKDPLEGLAPLPTVDLPVHALIPEDYVSEQAQRLFYYKLIMSARTQDELAEVQREITDRYGRMPDEVIRALAVMRLRLMARDLAIEKIDGNGGRMSVIFRSDADLSPRLFSLLQKRNRQCYVSNRAFIWPYTGSPLNAGVTMLESIAATQRDIEAQRAAFA